MKETNFFTKKADEFRKLGIITAKCFVEMTKEQLDKVEIYFFKDGDSNSPDKETAKIFDCDRVVQLGGYTFFIKTID